tara:strand:- start:53 stop:367 length:315 start_codon:yes stop_codon:yes gene_type:complete
MFNQALIQFGATRLDLIDRIVACRARVACLDLIIDARLLVCCCCCCLIRDSLLDFFNLEVLSFADCLFFALRDCLDFLDLRLSIDCSERTVALSGLSLCINDDM